MSIGYKAMIAFFILACIAGVLFFPYIGGIKFLSFVPLIGGIYVAVSDPEKFDPESSRFWTKIGLMFAAAFFPLLLFIIHQQTIL